MLSFTLFVSLMMIPAACRALEPTWESLDARPLPSWYDDAKFGIFLHWGVFSVPSFDNEWFWEHWKTEKTKDYQDFVDRTERPGFSYREYAGRFHAEFYNPDDWTQIFAEAGAQYVVLTSKHHEGYCMWNSTGIPATWGWNVMDVGPRRDVLGELSEAVQKTVSPHTGQPIQFGVYHSLYEWYNPLYLADKRNNFTTRNFVDDKTLAELYDLVQRYHPTLIWSDGNWEASSEYWKSTEFLHWYATKSPVADQAVWNDRWGSETMCKHGAFLNCEDSFFSPELRMKKWEDATTIDKTSWGLNRRAKLSDCKTVKELIHTLIPVVAFNGNFLLNAGPAADGTIHPIFVDRLLGIGKWLKVNGEAIYGTRPWLVCQNETASNVYYTRKDDRLYVHMTEWPQDCSLQLSFPVTTEETRVALLGYDDDDDGTAISWESAASTTTTDETSAPAGLKIHLPALTPNLIPCEHAWVLVLTGIGNLDQQHPGVGSMKHTSMPAF